MDKWTRLLRGRSGLILAGLLATGACASSGSTAVATGTGGRSNTVLTREQLGASTARNLYEAIQALRPMWLVKRGQQSMENEGDIVIYLNMTRLGGPDELRQFELRSVSTVRYFDASSAQLRFGVGHGHGVIQVFTGDS